MKHSVQDEIALIQDLHSPALRDDPYAFTLYAYPWGQKQTPLELATGPRRWQQQELEAVKDHIAVQERTIAGGGTPVMWKTAIASGRGPGKSALVAWLVCWLMTTRLGGTVIVTANTEPQLKHRTFAEISKWTNLLINSHWFETTTLAIKPAEWFGALLRTQLKIDTAYYYCQAQLWSEESPESFAGAHNPLGMAVVFDEASGIPPAIFAVTQGFFTEPALHRYWWVFSNPRQNSGGFFDCFHSHKDAWRLRQIDSRTVEGLDPAVFQDYVKTYGVDSDTFRIEVLGQFPRQGQRQFISNEVANGAQLREVQEDLAAPLICGVDVARYGDDASVFRFRRGRDARSISALKFRERDNMFIANKLVEIANHYKPDAICVDAGNGTGVIDRCRELGLRVTEVWFGSSSSSKEWANKRTEMWADLRDWLGGGCIDGDPNLFRDLTAPEYDYFGKASDSVMLESKESMKGRGLPSPDDGDALALTFATKVARHDTRTSKTFANRKQAKDVDYPMFS